MKNIFVNKKAQVRSGWKIATVFSSFFLATNILSLLIVIPYVIFEVVSKRVAADNLSSFMQQLNNSVINGNNPLGFTCNVIQCICMIVFVFLFWRIFDKKPIKKIGLINIRAGYKDLFKGLILGAISLTLVFVILFTSGYTKMINPLSKPNFSLSLLSGLILFMLVGINEEMFARGYCITVLKQTGNRWVPVVLSSIIFALMHSLNSGMSILSYINLFLFALFASYMYIKSNNLWLSIGYHIAWNYFEGNVFGFLVSGQEADGLYSLKNVGDNIINGGKFGPEGGLVVTIILIAGFIYVWGFYKPSYKKGIIGLSNTIN